ncbi:hypothetical protein NUW58_g2811 [Xylaria curta]|uniref:Uncharacterized protein n=1 Tax=Xylaria curta TaxID=42375 RepID=A0ACC1PEQ7_9PEZI|nr:hypothetical protein NUW58_g2811 [Xylaria curta]
MASLKSSHQRQKARLRRVRHIINLIEETKNGGHLSGMEAIQKQLFPKDYTELLAQVDERDSDFQHYFNHHLRYEYRESRRGNSQFVIYILSAFRVSIQASIDYAVMSWMETVKHDGGNAAEVKTTAGRVRSTRDANIRMGNKLLRPDSSFRYRGYKGHPSIVFEIAWSQSTADLKKKAVELIHESAGQIRTVVGFDFSETYNIWPMIRDRIGTKNLPNRGPATAFIWRAMEIFDSHCREHAEIQARLKRSGGRTYGARYDPKQTSSQSSSQGTLQTQKETDSVPVPHPTGSPPKPSKQPPESRRTNLVGLDKRVHSIIESFPPHDGDGVEAPWPAAAEFKCKDCDFKFRTEKERDEHYLSRYCHGADVLFYSVVTDKSQPRGYRVEKKTMALDGIKFPSLFQCQKCDSIFPTEEEKEKHQKTHPVTPSECLHCGKMFSTEYELDEHYGWHDDMEYRHKIETLEQQTIFTDEVVQLAHGIEMIPFPFPPGNYNNLKPRSDGELVGVSFISAEDIGRLVAPNGYIEEMQSHYLSIPSGLDEDTVKKSLETVPAVGVTQTKPDQGALNVTRQYDIPQKGPESDKTPVQRLIIAAHGRPGFAQMNDVSGRKRWVTGEALGHILNAMNEVPGVRAYFEAADRLESRGEIRQAMNIWVKALEALMGRDAGADEERKFLILMKIALLAQTTGLPDSAIEYYLRALDLSVKIYGKDGINNFQIINELAVLFENQGMVKEAAHLYRRSLLGRTKVNGASHADTLMTTQELGNVCQKLGNVEAARSLLEQAYIGYENLEEKQERMTMMTLNNLAATYGGIGMKHEAVALLESAIPRTRDSLGTGDQVTCYAICNLLQYTEGSRVSDEVWGVINDIQENMTDHGSVAIQCVADRLALHRRLGEAEGMYRKLYDWRRVHFGSSDPETIHALYSLARCLDFLQRPEKAEEAFKELARLTASSLENRQLNLMATQEVARLNDQRNRLQNEMISWGCQIIHFCSSDCERSSQGHKPCYPTVTPAQSISTIKQPIQANRSPKLLSSEAFYVDPTCFAPVRIRKDPSKLVVYSFNPDIDIRVAIADTGPVAWKTPAELGMTYLYANEDSDPFYILITPGEQMLLAAKSEWRKTTGANVEIDFPTLEMIEYLQSEEPREVRMEMAFIMLVWEM